MSAPVVAEGETAGEAGTERAPRVWSRLYRGETAFDFVGRRRRWFLLSGAVILIGLISLFTRGLNFGIDFRGGTAWQVPTASVSVPEVRAAITPLGLGSATIEALGTGHNRTIEVQYRLSGSAAHQSAVTQAVTTRLAHLAGVATSVVSTTFVGPTWGGQITTKALEGLVAFFVLISAYIALRFEWKMALAAVVAVVHDLLVTVGIYSLSGFQVTPSTVVAVLTILGYSLYDTIVVFDRVRENARGLTAQGRLSYSDTVNLSMNQVLMRSLNTSIVAILPILSVLLLGAQVLGATTLQQFGLALAIGLTTGAYSSIFIASPLLAALKEREPRYRLLRERLAQRGEAHQLLTPAAAAGGRGLRTGANGTRGAGGGRRGAGRPDDAERVSAPRTAVGVLTPAASRRGPDGPGPGTVATGQDGAGEDARGEQAGRGGDGPDAAPPGPGQARAPRTPPSARRPPTAKSRRGGKRRR